MKPYILLVIMVFAGCASSQERSQQYIQSLVLTCNQMGYVEAKEEVACVRRLHSQAQAQEAAETDAFLQGFNQNRPVQTTCQKDALGRVNCTSR